MPRSTRLGVLLLLAVAAASRALADPPPSTPETVKALRYRAVVADSFTDFNHGGGYWVEHLWFPDRHVAALLHWEWKAADRYEATAYASFQDEIGNWCSTRPLETEREQPTEEVAVPRELAERLFALAEAGRRIEEERKALGPLVAASNVLRRIPGERESRGGGGAGPAPAADVSPSDAARAWLKGWAEPEGKEVDLVTRFPARVKRAKDGGLMVLVPRGRFGFGDEARTDEAKHSYGRGPSREAKITQSYYLDVDEVTVAQWTAFRRANGGAPAAESPGEGTQPVRDVSFSEASAFAAWAGCSLPTEGQWERAARADVRYALFANDAYHDVAEKRNGLGAGDGFEGPAPVGSFPPNAWGLRDLSGNVAEWCADRFAAFPEEVAGKAEVLVDPAGPQEGTERVVKGGSYLQTGDDLSIGHREHLAPDSRRKDVGFRCARSLP